MPFPINQKRAIYKDVTEVAQDPAYRLALNEAAVLERLDVVYRALVAILYNFVPSSGHPGGSISSGRFVSHLMYKNMLYNFSNPLEESADIISYAAGHKALGLYALWALRNECVRVDAPELLPADELHQLRLEDLLGVRHNSKQGTPLFTKFHSKPLGGHPEPITPFVRTSTGASGVGDGSAVGLALAAADAVITPVQAAYLPAKGLEQFLMTVSKGRRQINPTLKMDGILLSMVDARTNYAKEIISLIYESYGTHLRIFQTQVPFSVRAAEASASGCSILSYDPRGKVAKAYRRFAEEVTGDVR